MLATLTTDQTIQYSNFFPKWNKTKLIIKQHRKKA